MRFTADDLVAGVIALFGGALLVLIGPHLLSRGRRVNHGRVIALGLVGLLLVVSALWLWLNARP